jgi:hypothetical protein
MKYKIFKFPKPSAFLVSEFVIIVLGVLAALAVDGWNTARSNDEIKMHLVTSLLMDLRQDQEDYSEFVTDSIRRAEAANIIGRLANGEDVDLADENMTAAEALYYIARSSRLETVEVTFREMTASGSGTSIEDAVIRLTISYYYGLARDRADINDLILPAMLRYRAYLEEVGMSYVDKDDLDIDIILGQPKIMAVVRELGTWAAVAASLAEDLEEANRELILELESFST